MFKAKVLSFFVITLLSNKCHQLDVGHILLGINRWVLDQVVDVFVYKRNKIVGVNSGITTVRRGCIVGFAFGHNNKLADNFLTFFGLCEAIAVFSSRHV